ncbi:UTP9 [Candida jiufengensis]|uniref:UTP9 n=1 Tax=Candida jiufengensis TaxID=497108 RepID=UPI0022247407|nr:UTP9 [Candida jiufengensis]KAI5952816.1 UTP9 [Candida jiufengensis]
MKYSIQKDRIAKLISRNDENNEIQFFTIDINGELNLTGTVLIDEPIIDFIWSKQIANLSNGHSNGHKALKKRSLNGEEKSNTHEDFDGKLIALTKESILIISPTSNSIIENKSNDSNISSLVKAENGIVWGNTAKNDTIITLNLTNSEINRIKVPKFQSILINEEKVYIGTKSNLQIGQIESNKFVEQNEIAYKKGVQEIQPLKDQILIESNNQINLISNNSTNNTIYKGDDIIKVQILKVYDEPHIFIITSNSIKIISLDGKLLNEIFTTQSIDEILQIEDELFIIWHIDNEINFQKFTLIQKDIVVNQPQTQPTKSHPVIIDYEESIPITKQTEEEIESNINSIEKLDSTILIESCSSTDDSDLIKTLVIKLSTPQMEKLYQIISEEISKDSTKNFNLTIWLKWILLVHGNFIAKNTNLEIKSLHSNLSNGLKILPSLYSIKGKLQLLKLQSEIRQKPQEESNDITTTIDEDGIIFANGEVDDTNTTIA